MYTSPACSRCHLPDWDAVRSVHFRAAADSAIPRSTHRCLRNLKSENFLRKDLQYLHFQGNITQTFLEVLVLLPIVEALKAYTRNHPFDPGSCDGQTVLDQLYQAYCESHESDPPEISEGFKELESFLESLPLDDNNAVFSLCCRLCTAYERKAFHDGLLYGANLMQELFSKGNAQESSNTRVR